VKRHRSGIIGTGFVGSVHARAVRAAGGVVSAVAASTKRRSEDAAVRLDACRAAPTAEELISSEDIDVVHICTPNNLHVRFAEQALTAGKHVVCEKPLALHTQDAARLTAVAASAGVVAAVPFVYRFYSSVREARERARRGEVGRLHLLHGSYLQDWLCRREDFNWRVDPETGGASRTFADIGIHWMDLMEFVSGHRATRICARTLNTFADRGNGTAMANAQTEDAAIVLFETDKGAIGSMVASQVTPGRKNRLWFSFDGTEQSLSFDQELPDSLWVGSRSETKIVPRGVRGALSARTWDILPPGHPQGYQDAFTAFIADVYRTIQGQVADGLPTFADGLRAATLTEAVLESAAAREWQSVE
jgi:predicted dehydrogenase